MCLAREFQMPSFREREEIPDKTANADDLRDIRTERKLSTG